MEAWTQLLKTNDANVANNVVDKYTGFGDAESEPERERARKTEIQLKILAFCKALQALIAQEGKCSTARNSALVRTEVLEDKLICALQKGYDATKEMVNIPLFNLREEVIMEIIQHRKIDSLQDS